MANILKREILFTELDLVSQIYTFDDNEEGGKKSRKIDDVFNELPPKHLFRCCLLLFYINVFAPLFEKNHILKNHCCDYLFSFLNNRLPYSVFSKFKLSDILINCRKYSVVNVVDD